MMHHQSIAKKNSVNFYIDLVCLVLVVKFGQFSLSKKNLVLVCSIFNRMLTLIMEILLNSQDVGHSE